MCRNTAEGITECPRAAYGAGHGRRFLLSPGDAPEAILARYKCPPWHKQSSNTA
jgi:hypothetical protein